MSHRRPSRRAMLTVAVVLLGLAPAAFAQDDEDDLQSLLEQVGREYAEGYLAPLTNAWGANQNSALYHTARIPGAGVTFGIALKFMGAHMSEDDQTFRRVIQVDDVSEFVDGAPAAPGAIVMQGPSVIGDPDAAGTVTAYVNGLPVGSQETIEGLIDTRWVPLAAPEASIGGIVGAKLTVRWLPEIDLDDYGKTKYFGWGLQFSPNHYLPSLPVDVAVGFFKQEIDAGTVLETDAHALFLAASKDLGMATVYGGFAKEEGTMKVSYTETSSQQTITFETESVMDNRFTLGATLNLGAKLFGEAAFGELTVFSAGLVFGM